MNCKKCGGALGENAKFCAACGEKVTEQEALEKKVVKTAKDVSPKKKKKKGFGLIFFLLICVAILAVAVIYMRGKGISAKHEIDLGKYVSIEYEGYSGLGIASWDFEKREFFDDYEEELKFPAKLKEKAKLVEWNKETRREKYILFSANGYTKELKEQAVQNCLDGKGGQRGICQNYGISS